MDTNPIPGFDAALQTLQPDLSEPVMWLVPSDEKHFDGMSMVYGFGSALLMAFLAGFQEEATTNAKALGGYAMKWLAGQLKAITERSSSAVPLAVSDAAGKGAQLMHGGESDAAALAGSEAAIAAVLGDYMPAEQAAAAAARVRAAVAGSMRPAST